MHEDNLRLVVQGGIALAVLGCATVLAWVGRIDGGVVAALFGGALAAVGSGTIAQRTPAPRAPARSGDAAAAANGTIGANGGTPA